LSRECSAYLVDTNVIISAVIRGDVPRRCLETCSTRYLVPEPVIEELLELLATEDFQDIVDRIERKLSKRRISVEELLAREIRLVATLLRSSIEYLDVKPDIGSLVRAEEVIGHRDPNDIPIVAIALHLAKTYRNEKICIWTDDRDILGELPKKEQAVKAVPKPHCCKVS